MFFSCISALLLSLPKQFSVDDVIDNNPELHWAERMSDQKQRDHLVQTQKLEALGMFVGGIAHDFNNILSIIEGYTSIAVKQLKEGTLTPEQLQKILASTKRGAGLTRQLLAFGRQKVALPEKMDLSRSLRQEMVLLKPLMGETVQVFMTLPEEPVWIEAGEDQITQIILNLCLNARDAMPEGGEVAVMCMESLARNVPQRLRGKNLSGRFVRITVMDSGSGIAPEALPKIFDPFFTTKDQGRGTGLGLSVVYGIVDQLGGAIEVESKIGEGSSFDVYLPQVAPPLQASAASSKNRSTSLAGKTILVAEDEPELRDVLVHMFDGMEMTVLTSANGNQALLTQEDYEGPIDFLLTDVVMPEMDGVRLGELFHAVRPDTNVIYMSGYPFMDGRKNIQVPENAPFIAKPLHEERIRQILERALERRNERIGVNGGDTHGRA